MLPPSPGSKRAFQRFDSKALKKQLKVRDVRFANNEELAQLTDGVLSGGVNGGI